MIDPFIDPRHRTDRTLDLMMPDLPAVEAAIVEMTNAFRGRHERAALRRNPALDRVARSYAAYLARTRTFSHTADGRNAGERAVAGGYKYCWIGENLASHLDSRGFRTRQLARLALEGWKNSPGHRRNLLQRLPTEIGVGVAKSAGEEKYLSVQVFGRPETLRFSFKVENRTQLALSYTYGQKSHALPVRTIMTRTVCAPEALDFRGNRHKSAKGGRVFTYTTRPNDVFVVKPAERGRFRVEHRPRVD